MSAPDYTFQHRMVALQVAAQVASSFNIKPMRPAPAQVIADAEQYFDYLHNVVIPT